MTLPTSGAISFSDINTELGLSATAQISMNDTVVRTLFGTASGAIDMNTGHNKSNTSVPGAPTGVSASASSSSAISVSFSAPACTGHLTIDYYQVVCTGSGTNSATGSSPISVSGLSPSTAYTFKVRAHNSKGYGCYSSTASATTSAARGCIVYCTTGTYSWTAPAGVTSVSVVVVQAGNPGSDQTYSTYYCGYNGQTIHTGVGNPYGGYGGALAWRNNISVTPGSTYPIFVGTQNQRSSFNYVSSCCVTKTVIASNGTFSNPYPNRSVGDCWSWGGCGGASNHSIYYRYSSALYAGGGGYGGGAAGYSRYGGGLPTNQYHAGGSLSICQFNGVNGGGGSGNISPATASGGGGGGVGLYGRGSNGSFNGALCSGSGRPNLAYGQPHSEGGGGGSGGSAGGNGGNNDYTVPGGNGGNYGGGGGAGSDGTNYTNPHFSGLYQSCTWYSQGPGSYGGAGGKAAVRIIWPGCSRLFPNGDVGNT